ncbi:MAG TPA: type II secretion system protein, partial [Gaiellaceae bacterium]|nr:type II secretion system protein [Gaiellaceae bacterium]
MPPLVRSESGYTLVELIVVMALLSIVLGALTTLWVSGSNTELRLNRQFQAQQTARLALDRVRTDIHCASAATAGTVSTYQAVTLAYPASGCSTTTVYWCAVPSTTMTGRYALWRSTSAASTCTSSDTSRQLEADDLTTSSNVFSTSLVNNSLERVGVDFPVSVNPTATADVFELKDSIVVA